MDRSDDNQRLLALAESMSGIGRWRLDLATGRSLWSDAVYAMFGVDREGFDPLHKNIVALCHPDDRAKMLPDVAAARMRTSGFEVEFRIIRPDGEIRHVLSRAICETDERHPDLLARSESVSRMSPNTCHGCPRSKHPRGGRLRYLSPPFQAAVALKSATSASARRQAAGMW